MRLSKHFELKEFTRTTTGLPNEPTAAGIDALQALCLNVLEPWRAEVGRLYVTSGWRSPAVNAAVNGAEDSDHLKGRASDCRPLDMDIGQAWQRLVRMAWVLPVGQLILYVRKPEKGWIHVSHDPTAPYRRDIRVDVPGRERTVHWSAYEGPLVLG